MVEPLEFFVQGSEEEPYSVRIPRLGERVLATCTCKAGIVRQLCKHRIRIMKGEIHNMPAYLKDTIVPAAFQQIERLEKEIEEAKRALARAKESLAKSFYESSR